MPTIDAGVLVRLRAVALDATKHAYAPYSKFYVGAALLFDDGSVFTGCNVENVSYGLTSCAERNALFRAISERGAGAKIVAVAVANAADAVVTFPGEHGWETMAFAQIFPSRFHFEPEAR
jgi:cytidine deaminase